MTRVYLKHRLCTVAVDQSCFAHFSFLNQATQQRFAFDVFTRDLKVTPIIYVAYFQLKGRVNVPFLQPGTGLLR